MATSKNLLLKTLWDSGVFVVNFERISYLFLFFSIVDFEQVNVGWVHQCMKLLKAWVEIAE